MPTGVVKWWNGSKGYGFIKPDDGSDDVFVHASALKKSGMDDLMDDDRVSYDLEPGKKGMQAKNVKVVASV